MTTRGHDPELPDQGYPDTIAKLEGAVENSLQAAFIGASWAAWIGRGIDPSACPKDAIFFPDWRPPIFSEDPDPPRRFHRNNLYQFLLRGLLRDCAQFVEHFMDATGIGPRGRDGKIIWSETAVPIYVLRILRNGFNHSGWTIGRIHADVKWNGVEFKKNVGGADAPEGFRETDSILSRLPQDKGAICVVHSLMIDVIDELNLLEE